MTYTPSPIEVAVYSWVSSVLDSHTVVYANQGSPRPSGDHATILITTDAEVRRPRRYMTSTPSDDDFEEERFTEREATVSIQTFGQTAYQDLKGLVDSRDDYSTRSVLESEKLSIRQVGDVQRLFQPKEGGIESRSVVNITIGYSEKSTSVVPIISEVISEDNF